MQHADYPGILTTAGNMAVPVSPFGIPVGPAYRFSVYHLMPVADPLEVSRCPQVPEQELLTGDTLDRLAKVIRSKNAGPFELTFDIMFDDAALPEGQAVRRDQRRAIAAIYRFRADDIWYAGRRPAVAFKITIRRPVARATSQTATSTAASSTCR